MKLFKVVITPILIVGLSLVSQTLYAADLMKLRVGQTADKTRLVFEIKHNHRFEISRLSNPARLVVDFYKTRNQLIFTEQKFLDKRLAKVRVAEQASKDDQSGPLRVVLDLKDEFDYRYFTLAKTKSGHERIVIDVVNTVVASTPPVVKAPPVVAKLSSPLAKKMPKVDKKVPLAEPIAKIEPKPDLIVAIDAGHGGRDTGAIGNHKTYEKTVSLVIAKQLKKIIDSTPGMRAVLTREKDEYISLDQRVQIAHRHKADIFLSIHADSFPNAQAQGGSVYVLSTQGASSLMARILAQSENASLQNVKLQGRDSDVAFVLSDMTREANIRASRKLGQMVLAEMDGVVNLHKSKVQSADFAVLKSIDMPSLLIETAFISNPQEEKRLKSHTFQTKMARSIVTGISKFVAQNASQPRWGEKLYVHYKVQAGDTLSEIAYNYGIRVSDLKALNQIHSANQLMVGKRLKIPVSEKVVAGL